MSQQPVREGQRAPPAPRLIGVIGNTGQGKSSLLEALHKIQGSQNSRIVTNLVRSPVGLTVKQYITCGAKMQASNPASRDAESQGLLDSDVRVQKPPKRVDARVKKLLRYFELDGCAEFPLNTQGSDLTISHGQRARVNIAFVLASVPKRLRYLMLDEPMSPLDLNTAVSLGTLFHELVHTNTTDEDLIEVDSIILTVHQPPATIWRLIDHIIIVHNMTIIFAGPRERAEYFLLAHYSQCQREPDFQDPATRVYAILEDLDTQRPDMSWVKHHESEFLQNLRTKHRSPSANLGSGPLRDWLRRQMALIALISQTMWLASKWMTLLFGPLAFLSHGLVLGGLLRKNYEHSQCYNVIQDSRGTSKDDTVPITLFDSQGFKAFERIWPLTREEPRLVGAIEDKYTIKSFEEFRASLNAEELAEDPDFNRWPLNTSAGSNESEQKPKNPLSDYMKNGPHGNGRIDTFDALVFSTHTLKYAHKLLWCVRDNVDLFKEEMELPKYQPKFAEWMIPFRRDQDWRNNIYEAFTIPDSIPTLAPSSNRHRQLQERAEQSSDNTNSTDKTSINWDSDHWDHLTAPLISTEISALLQMLEIGMNDWDWQNFRACNPKSDALNFYLCILSAYPQRLQSVIRCAGLPQLPSFIAKQLDIPDPPFVAPSNLIEGSGNVTSEGGGIETGAFRGRRLFLEYDEHWKLFVGLRQFFRAVGVSWIYRLIVRLLHGVILSLTAGVCLYFLIISSGFFCMQAISQWVELRGIGAEYRLNGIITHAYEFILAFNIASWPQTAWLSIWVSTSYLLVSGLSWDLIPWAIPTLTLYIQALVGYVLLVGELTSSIRNKSSDAVMRIIVVILVALVELSGFFIRPSNYPQHWYWLSALSPYRWATEILNLQYARPHEYSSESLVPQEVVLAILGNRDRSTLMCFGVLVLLYLLTLGLATALYTIRVATADCRNPKNVYLGADTPQLAELSVIY